MNNRNLVGIRGGGLNGHGLFEKVISTRNLLQAWREFKRGKGKAQDIQEFKFNLKEEIFSLHTDLKNRIYVHSGYTAFYVTDPKVRHIHKATVRDRVFHHALFRILYPIFDPSFIHDSYSCRVVKGTHRGVDRLKEFLNKASHNNTRKVWALKCDVRKFFDSIDQDVLRELIRRKVSDSGVLWLVDRIVESFSTGPGKGLPLGNVTSQLFANIYLNELDQFVKHRLKIQHYLRYCDDFIILGHDPEALRELVGEIDDFLKNRLRLSLHERKVIIRSYRQGIDFLGYVVLPHHRVLRAKTKQRILKKVARGVNEHSFRSYLGILKHCDGYGIETQMKAFELLSKKE